MKAVTQKIGLGWRKHRSRQSLLGFVTDSAGCQINVIGAGAESFTFPPANVLVQRALARAGKAKTKIDTATKTNTEIPVVTETSLFWQDVSAYLPRLEEIDDKSDQKTMVESAEALRILMNGRRFDGIVDVRFSTMIAATLWARDNMPDGFAKTLTNMIRQISRLKRRYKKALKELVAELKDNEPETDIDELVVQATELIDEELSESLSVLEVYSDSFAQYRDGAYARELELINFYFEQSAELFHSIDPVYNGAESGSKTRKLKTNKFKVGDRYIARIVTGELSTMPGSLGPVGLHALEVPVEMLDFLFLLLPLLAHELFHDIYYDVEGLEQELVDTVKKAIRKAIESGDVVLKNEFTGFGAGSIASVDLMEKLFADLLSEIAADVCGGVLLSGPAFLTTMLVSFPAMGMNDQSVSSEPRLLANSSQFSLEEKEDGRLELTFAPHPADYVRVLGLTEVLKTIGMNKEAERFKPLAVFGAGRPQPEYITYTSEDGRDDLTLRLSVLDLQALAPIVANVLIHAQLKSLGNRSMWQMYNWTDERQSTVLKLVDLLVAGRYSVPTNIGNIYANYIGAAAPLAFWELVKAGKGPVRAAKQVNNNAMKMLQTHKRRLKND